MTRAGDAIARLRELEKAATPGPWEHREHDGLHAVAAPGGWALEPDERHPERERADVVITIAARNALPALLDCAALLREVADYAGEQECTTMPPCGCCVVCRARAALEKLEEVAREK